jgi:acyl-CoA dehydrogenase
VKNSCSQLIAVTRFFYGTVLMNADAFESPWMSEETRIFQRSVRQFVEKELVPQRAHWERQGRADPETWVKAGEMGMLLPAVPEQYGGGGGSFAHEAVVIEELARANLHLGFDIQSIVARHILSYGNEEQKQRWLPRLASGELIGAIGMTEPDSGSDLQAIKTTARRRSFCD